MNNKTFVWIIVILVGGIFLYNFLKIRQADDITNTVISDNGGKPEDQVPTDAWSTFWKAFDRFLWGPVGWYH